MAGEVSRSLVEQNSAGAQGRCWRNGEGHGDLSQVCTNHPEPGGGQEGDGREQLKRAGKSSPGNCLVALEDNKPQTVLCRPELTLHCRGDGDKILLPSGAACP